MRHAACGMHRTAELLVGHAGRNLPVRINSALFLTVFDAPCAPGFAFDYSVYALNEQYLHIKSTLVTVLGFALAAAAAVMLPLIVHPFTELLVLLIICAVEVELYGLIYWFDMRLNAVVVANLVMSTGFAIEFTAHVSRAFMLAEGSRDARAAAALHELAPPVLNGALTTLLGLAPILVSQYSYFRLYFLLQCAPFALPFALPQRASDRGRERVDRVGSNGRCGNALAFTPSTDAEPGCWGAGRRYAVIVVVCLINGLVLLPVLLSLVGPDSLTRRAAAFEEEENKAVASPP
jgi:hypothetical protein